MTYTTVSAALAAVKSRSLLIEGNLSDDQIKRLLAEYTTVDATLGTTSYDVTGCTIACLRSLIGSIPTSRSIGGISFTNDSITAAIKELSRNRGGMVTMYHETPEETQL